jgi:hypothetical protein
MSMLGESPEDDLPEFWKNALNQPWGQKHPCAQDRDNLGRTIPMLIHLDGVETFTNQEANIWSFSSCFTSGCSTWDSKFILCAVPLRMTPSHSLKQGFTNEICRFLRWSFSLGMSGVMPDRGFYAEQWAPNSWRHQAAGKPIAGLYRICFVGSKCDLKARREVNLLKRHYRATDMCDQCMAQQCFKKACRELNYADFTPGALHLDTEISHEGYERIAWAWQWSFFGNAF